MQSRCYKTILTLFVRSAVFLALSIPATGYTDNSVGSSSGYRSSHGISSGYRGLARGHREHSTHRLNSRNSHFAAIKQKNSVESTSGNRGSQRLSSGSRNLNKSQALQSSSRHERNHKQREKVVNHNKRGYSNHNKRLGIVGQKIISGRNKSFKTQNNSGLPASKLKNRLIRKNLGLTKSIKSQVNPKHQIPNKSQVPNPKQVPSTNREDNISMREMLWDLQTENRTARCALTDSDQGNCQIRSRVLHPRSSRASNSLTVLK